MPNPSQSLPGLRVAVIYSLPSKRMLTTSFGATDNDTGNIASTVAQGLQSLGMIVSLHAISEEKIGSIADISVDCVFNLIEWCGLDITLSQKAFGYMRGLTVPVTGSSEAIFCLTGNKIEVKQALRDAGIPTPAGQVFVSGHEKISALHYPVIVKPAYEHCSMGLGYDSLAHSELALRPIVTRQIRAFSQPAIAEEFIEGREFMVYLLEENDEVKVLPVEEVRFKSNRPFAFQTYETKWVESDPDYQSTDVVVAELRVADRRAIETACAKAFRQIGIWGYGRFDIRLRQGVPYILETNANPSVYDDDQVLTDVNHEVIPGITFSGYLSVIIKSAFYHFRRSEFV